MRGSPPQVIDYVWCVTEEGVLVVGQQVRILDATSGQYVFAKVTSNAPTRRWRQPCLGRGSWTFLSGREVPLTLEVRAMSRAWPVRAVTVTPSVSQ